MDTAEGYARAKALFLEASRLPRGERTRFLRTQCGADAALEGQVRRLLTLEVEDDGFLDSPPVSPPAHTIGPGARLGRFQILRVLGEGGMGIVYEAQEDEPERRVALKLVRPGLFSDRLRARFRHEIRVLGQLRHPGIAQIYEAGTLAHEGQHVPYFAMELVEGKPLLAFAAGFGVRDRLSLIAQVCDAVHHAHQKGVIHRDLKPGNILVEEAATGTRTGGDTGSMLPFQVKVLDFGVARAIDTDEAATVHTQAGQLIGTLSYMSPEQSAGDPDAIDIRSDVYAIGVIACELLIGRLPYDLAGRTLPEAAGIIRDQEPVRLGVHDRALRGDAETIVAKALHKDRRMRYQSAAEFAADIRRYLRDEPIVARAPSALYQLRKFARRHRPLAAAIALAAAALVGATGFSAWQARVAVRARDRAEGLQKKADRSAATAKREARRAALAATAAAIDSGDPIEARRLLDGVDEGLRGWAWQYWNARLDQSIAVIKPDTSVVDAWTSPDGAEIVAVTIDGSILRGPATTGVKVCARLEQSPVRRAVIVDGGRRLVAACGDRRRVGVFDSASGKLIKELDELESPVGLLEATADGAVICAGLNLPGRPRSQVLWVWHAAADADAWEGRRIKGTGTSGVGLSSDGNWLAFGDTSITVEGTRRGDGTVIATEARGKLQYALSGDGSLIATGGDDKLIRVRERGTGRQVASMTGHAGGITALAFDPLGMRIASAGRDLTIRLWDAHTGASVAVLPGHTGRVDRLVFSADGSRLVSVSADGSARVWQADPFEGTSVLRGHTSYVYDVAFTPDGSRIVSGGWDETVRVWDAAGGAPLRSISTPHGFVTALAVSPDGNRIVTGHKLDESKAGEVWLWDAATGREVGELGRGVGGVCEVVFSNDGSRVWAAWDHRGVDEFDLTASPAARRNVALRGEPRAIAVSPNATELACGNVRGQICIMETATGRVVRTLEGHRGMVTGLAFHPTRRLLASSSADGTARLWDLATGECTAVLEGHWDKVYAIAFSPDGKLLATGSEDTTIVLWDMGEPGEYARPEMLTRLRGHDAYVYALAFSPDGTRLVSTSGDRTVRVWDTRPVNERWRSKAAAGASGK